MDRRSFVMALFGGLAVASVGGIAASEAAQPKLAPLPTRKPEELPEEMKDGLDKTDADFSQYYYYRRPRYYRRHYYRPRYYYRPRRYYYRRRYYW